jgi:tetratricopeptide (TPR) repeat protein
VYRRFDHLEEALAPLTEIVEHHRGHARGPIAIDLLLHALNRLGREDELSAWVERLVGDETLEAGLRARLRALDRQARRKKLEACVDEDYVACGQGYVELWNEDTDAADGDQLLWNAALYFEQARSIGSAIAIFEALVRQYPKSDLAARSLIKLGDNYARVAWYREAAEKLEQYAKTYGGEKDAYGALSDAVVYRKGIGDDKQAITDTAYFVDAFGDRAPAAAADAYFSLTRSTRRRATSTTPSRTCASTSASSRRPAASSARSARGRGSRSCCGRRRAASRPSTVRASRSSASAPARSAAPTTRSASPRSRAIRRWSSRRAPR